MKKLMIAAATILATASAASANCGIGVPCSVPEISALEGTAALAAVAALVMLAWERRRRAS